MILNQTVVEGRSKGALLDILKALDIFPMMGGTDFDETNWSWKGSLLKLRLIISNKTDNIFKTPETISDMTEEVINNLTFH